MYSIAIIKSSINLYFKLKKDNIIGKKRIKYIEHIFQYTYKYFIQMN